jgi:predicted kinase
MTSRRRAPVLVVTGAPGVGKSTVAREVAERLPVCAFVEADELHRMIISGGEWPSAGSPQSLAQLELRTLQAATLAHNFSDMGIPTVIDEVLGLPVQVRILEETLAGCNVAIVGLSATSETIARRDAGRQRHTAHLYAGIERMIRHAVETTWIDTTRLSIDETVEELLGIIDW